MNTDKLMELERKWRAEAADLSTQAGREFRRGNYESQLELAQAAQDASSRADELAALRAEQAVGTARQSEGVVLVPREPTEAMKAAGDYDKWNYDDAADIYRAMIDAAPKHGEDR